MPLSLEQLRTVATTDQELARIVDILDSLGFNASSWQSGSVQRTIIETLATVSANFTEVAAAIANMAFNDTSSGSALTAFSDSHYDNQRVTAVATEGDYTLTGGAVGPPHAIVAGDVTVADAAGRLYTNTTGGTVPVSGTLVVSVKAQVTGEDGNVANDTITILKTPLAGVTGSNSAIAPSTTWITTLGLDQEADATLRTRNTTKWATLNSLTRPADAYINLALDADSDVTRVLVDDTNPRGAGTVDVYLARATGTAQAADVTTVQTAFDAKRGISDDPLAIAATEQSQDFTATISVTSSLLNATKEAEIEQALTDHINGLPVGGTTLTSSSGFILFSEWIQAVSAITGVVNVAAVTPTADVAVTANNVVTVGTITFTYVAV